MALHVSAGRFTQMSKLGRGLVAKERCVLVPTGPAGCEKTTSSVSPAVF